MKERRLAALVDRPGTRSQRMPALIFTEEGVRYVSGMVGGVRKMTPDDGDFDFLVRNSDILKVKNEVVPGNLKNPAAHWIGDEFARKSREIDAPELPDMGAWQREEMGRFTLDEPKEILPRLEAWVREAALMALREPEKASDCASLMAQTIMKHPLTCAITWYVEDKGEGGVWLNFYSQMFGKSGKRLIAEFRNTIDMLKKEAKG